jgi:NADH dehydrogenase
MDDHQSNPDRGHRRARPPYRGGRGDAWPAPSGPVPWPPAGEPGFSGAGWPPPAPHLPDVGLPPVPRAAPPPRRGAASVHPAAHPTGSQLPPLPRQSRLLALLFRYRPSSHAQALTTGLLLGVLWWLAVALTLVPLLAGGAPLWTVVAAGQRLPGLLAVVLLSSLAGLLFQEAAVRHLGGEQGSRPGAAAPAGRRVRVVILGGGFGGVAVARRLERLLPRVPSMDVTIVSRGNALLFTPMLTEVAARSLEPNHVGVPVRAACPRTRFRLAEVDHVDTEEQLVHLRSGGSAAGEALPYDHLVLALGAVPNYLDLPGVRVNSVPLKTIGDAITLRNHVIARLERADEEQDQLERRRQLTFVVAGGGFAGVEIVAGLCDLVRGVRRYFPAVVDEAQFVLVHGGDRILPETEPELGDYALRKLRRRGVHCLLGTRVVGASPDAVALSDGSQLPTRTLVWAAGNHPSRVVAGLPFPHDASGAVVADASLLVAGCGNVWAVGDCAEIPDGSSGRPCPPTAQHAVRQAKALADNLVRVLEGRRPKPFRFSTVGFLATVGHHSAVADVRGLCFSGVLAWLMWRGIYLSKLPGVERRLRVLLDWAVEPLFGRDIALTSPDHAS